MTQRQKSTKCDGDGDNDCDGNGDGNRDGNNDNDESSDDDGDDNGNGDSGDDDDSKPSASLQSQISYRTPGRQQRVAPRSHSTPNGIDWQGGSHGYSSYRA